MNTEAVIVYVGEQATPMRLLALIPREGEIGLILIREGVEPPAEYVRIIQMEHLARTVQRGEPCGKHLCCEDV